MIGGCLRVAATLAASQEAELPSTKKEASGGVARKTTQAEVGAVPALRPESQQSVSLAHDDGWLLVRPRSSRRERAIMKQTGQRGSYRRHSDFRLVVSVNEPVARIVRNACVGSEKGVLFEVQADNKGHRRLLLCKLLSCPPLLLHMRNCFARCSRYFLGRPRSHQRCCCQPTDRDGAERTRQPFVSGCIPDIQRSCS